jgi:hypothetical protein
MTAFGTVKAPMARPEDLVVFKAIAGRGKDADDVVALLALYPDLDLARVRARELADLAESPELARDLDRLIDSAGTSSSRPAAKPAARKRSARRTRSRTSVPKKVKKDRSG